MSPETDEKIFDIVKGGFDYYYNAHSIDKTTPYEGTEKLLNDLEEKGIKTAVLSNKPDEFVAKILERFSLITNLLLLGAKNLNLTLSLVLMHYMQC